MPHNPVTITYDPPTSFDESSEDILIFEEGSDIGGDIAHENRFILEERFSTTVELPILRSRLLLETLPVQVILPDRDTTVALQTLRTHSRCVPCTVQPRRGRVRILTQGTQVIYGVSPGPFKLNPAMEIVRRYTTIGSFLCPRLPSNVPSFLRVIHLSLAKADVVTVFAQMQLITFTHRLEVGEFVYETPNRVLKVTNDEVVEEVLVLDDSVGEDAAFASDY